MRKNYPRLLQKNSANNKNGEILGLNTNIKRKKLKASAIASVFYTGTNFISRGMAFLFTPIFARAMTEAELGEYSLYLGWLGIITTLTTLEIHGSGLGRIYSKYGSENGARSAIITVLLIEIILGPTFLLFLIGFKKIELPTPLLIALPLQAMINSAEGIIFLKKRFDMSYVKVSALNLLLGILTPILSLLLVLRGLGARGRVYGSIASSLIIILPMALNLFKTEKKKNDLSAIKDIIKSSLPLLIYYVSLSFVSQFDKLVIEDKLNIESLATYSIALSTSQIIAPITSGLYSAILPILDKKARNEEKGSESILYEIFIPVSILLLLILSVMPEIYIFISGGRYPNGLGAAYPLSIGALFLFFAKVSGAKLISEGKLFFVSLGALITALISTLSLVYLTGRLGIFGASVISLLSYFTLFLIYTVKSEKNRKNVNNYLYGAIIISAVAFFLYYVKNSHASRLILILALLLLLFRRLYLSRNIFLK